MKKIINSNWIVIILGGFILIGIGFYNGFPLMAPDSFEYIESGFKLEVAHRPVLFGIFVRHISLAFSLWFVIIAQGLILSYLVNIFLNYFLNIQFNLFVKLIIYILLVVFSSVSWYCSQIMPDIFASVGLLIVILLLLKKIKKLYTIILLSIILIFSIASHNSNLLFFSTSLFVIGIYGFITKKFAKKEFVLNQYIIIFSISILAWFVSPTLNATIIKKNYSNNKFVFFTATMIESGMLKKVLDDNCGEYDWKLCEFKDKLPKSRGQFLWWKNSPLFQIGGWKGSEEELKEIFKVSFSKPEYYILNIFYVTKNTIKQFYTIRIGKLLHNFSKDKRKNKIIKERFFTDISDFSMSKQNTNRLEFLKSNNRQMIGIITLSIILFVLLGRYYKNIDKKDKNLLFTTLFFLIINATTVSALGGVSSRYQGRIFWLLSFVIIIFIINNYKKIQFLNKFSNKQIQKEPKN